MNFGKFLGAVAAVALVASSAAAEVSGGQIKVGVLTDMSGPFAHQTGQGSVTGANLAIEDFGGKVAGSEIVLLSADHQNNPDVALNIARQWFDVEGVDVVIDLASSAVALAVQGLAKEKNKVVLFTGPGTDRLTNADCSPNGVHWVYDTYANGNAMAKAVIQDGRKKWFFIGNDSAFGRSMVEVISKSVLAAGGEVTGEVWHPTGNSDFSAYMMQARSSGADVLLLANAGTDFIAATKQAREFGITDDNMRIVAPVVTLQDILSLGQEDAAGLHFVDAFFWNLNDDSRKLTERFMAASGKVPAQAQAGSYSAVRNYLAAVEATGSDDAAAVMEHLRSTPITDAFTPHGEIRVDGRLVHDMYLVKVKPEGAEKTTDWDVVELVSTIDGNDVFRPLAESQCPLVKN